MTKILSSVKPCPFKVGQAYLIRTVTMTWLGRVVDIVGDFLVLDSAAWIADTGRFHLASTPGALEEVEPAPGQPVFVCLEAVVDACPWNAPMATKPK